MATKWWMCNVVWYDGSDAFVSKFILQVVETGVTTQSVNLVDQELSGNGEVLKIDPLYTVDFDNIEALKEYKDSQFESEKQLFAAYNRFKEMWF